MSVFVTKATYEVVKRMTISELLPLASVYKLLYFIVNEHDDPILIRDSMSWLQTQNKNKKVWILRFKEETSQFEE